MSGNLAWIVPDVTFRRLSKNFGRHYHIWASTFPQIPPSAMVTVSRISERTVYGYQSQGSVAFVFYSFISFLSSPPSVLGGWLATTTNVLATVGGTILTVSASR